MGVNEVKGFEKAETEIIIAYQNWGESE